jgi:hypothetical protein
MAGPSRVPDRPHAAVSFKAGFRSSMIRGTQPSDKRTVSDSLRLGASPEGLLPGRGPGGSARIPWASRTFIRGWTVLVVLTACTGCTSWDLAEAWNWSNAAPKPQTPTRMTDVWTDTVFHQPGQRGVRGFGGRVMFYGEEGHKPIVVDGTFVVLAFDDTETEGAPVPPELKAPEKKYVILPDQLPNHYSKSDLGHSYSFWLPWDEVGGPERRICLIARFEPRKGRPIVSHPSHHVLPGPTASASSSKTASNAETRQDARRVKPVNYEAATEEPGPREELTTLTIDLPPSFAGGQKGKGADATTSGDQASESSPSAREAGKFPRNQGAVNASPSARSEPNRFPARRGSTVPPRGDHARRQPLPATWQRGLPPTPRSGLSHEETARRGADERDPPQRPRQGEE